MKKGSEQPPQEPPKNWAQLAEEGFDADDFAAQRASVESGAFEPLSSKAEEAFDLQKALAEIESEEVYNPEEIEIPTGGWAERAMAGEDAEDFRKQRIAVDLRASRSSSEGVDSSTQNAEDMLNEALASSPFSSMELGESEDASEDVVSRQARKIILPARMGYFSTSFNYWSGTSDEEAYAEAQKNYDKALARLRAELDRVKGLSPEHRAVLAESFVLEDQERLNAIRAALLPEKKQESVKRSKKSILKMPAKARRLMLAAAALFIGLTSDVPKSNELPTYQPTVERMDEGVRAPEAPARATPITVEASAQGVNQTFYRFFRLLRAGNPAAYERLSGGETNLVALAERFSQETNLWKVGEGVDSSVVLQPHDRVTLTPEGEIAFTRADGKTYLLTQDSTPVRQTWAELLP